MSEIFQDLLAWVSANPTWAHLVVFLVALIESLAVVGLIVPGVIMMLGAGALIATGALAFWPVCLWAVAGAVAGDGLSFWVGRHFEDRLKTLWPFSRYPQSLQSGISFFDKYGGKSVAFGRFVGPVRAVIPMVAGMMGMSPARFLVANVLSAVVWAPAYLIPGIVFGASLELAAEVAARLVVLILALVILLWLVAWIVVQLFLLFSPRAGRWAEGLLRWADVHPRGGEIARALADPEHPDAKTLAALAGLLILAALLFALVTGFAVAGAPELSLNLFVLDVARSLHSPAGDRLMAAFSRLADLTVILSLALAVWVWLRWHGEHRHANYWLAAAAFGLLAGPLLAVLLQVPRPEIGLSGLGPWSFPSSHALRATAVYGFLAVLLAAPMTLTWRWLPYAWATLITLAVSVSRLYFGAHWLTDVLGSMTLGLAWIASLGLAYRRHTEPARSWRGLGIVAVAALALSFSFQTLVSRESDLALYNPEPKIIAITEEDWRSVQWRELPSHREDLRQRSAHPMVLQYAGSLDTLKNALASKGWEPGNALSWDNAIRLLSPSLPLRDLPVIPHVHSGKHESLTFVKSQEADHRLTLRLWATPYRIGYEQTPLWIGTLTRQEKNVVLGLIAVPTTQSESLPRHALEELCSLEPSGPKKELPLLLRLTPQAP